MNSAIITDLMNAGKRGLECRTVTLLHSRANHEKPIHLYVVDFINDYNVETLEQFIKNCLNPSKYILHDLEEKYFELHSRTIKSFHVETPFNSIKAETKKFFDGFKLHYDKLKSIADEASDKVKDGGTCNFDNVFIRIPLNNKEVQRASIMYNIPFLNYMKNHSIFGTGYLLNVQQQGQGLKYEVAAEAMYQYLNSNGYDVSQWHQID